MSPIVLSAGIFLLTVGGIFLGSLLRDALGLVATMAALVVGLLIAAAKNSFDTQSGQVRQITADVVLLDNLLAQYGPEAAPLRAEIRTAIPLFADRLWSEKASDATARYEPNVAVEKVYIEIQSLAPQNDLQRSLQARAIAASTDIAQARLLLFTEKGNSIPLPFLGVLALWLIIIFASFSLFSSLNATVFISLALFALSSSCAIYLILELGRPFTGLMMISSAPLREALGPLSP
jgi:hypothetical protein